MSEFEYVSVLISIVLALGIAEITISWGRLLQNREYVQFSWLHGFWCVFAMFMIIQYWWGFWNYRTLEDWDLVTLVLIVLRVVSLVLCAIVITPTQIFSGNINLEDFYFENAKTFFLIGALTFAVAELTDIFLLGTPIFHAKILVRAAGIGAAVAVALTQRKAVHRAFPLAGFGLLTVFMLNTMRL